jgi:hypothetical protein
LKIGKKRYELLIDELNKFYKKEIQELMLFVSKNQLNENIYNKIDYLDKLVNNN